MPARIHEEVFGPLEWDDQLGCWLGGINWPGELHTEVAIWCPDGDVWAGLRQAREGLGWLESNEEHARRCVAGAMCSVWKQAWRRADEEPMDEEEFVEILEVLRIGFVEDGSLLLTYDLADLFGGHVLDAEFDRSGSFRGAHLVG
jgi:hypothetical protein